MSAKKILPVKTSADKKQRCGINVELKLIKVSNPKYHGTWNVISCAFSTSMTMVPPSSLNVPAGLDVFSKTVRSKDWLIVSPRRTVLQTTVRKDDMIELTLMAAALKPGLSTKSGSQTIHVKEECPKTFNLELALEIDDSGKKKPRHLRLLYTITFSIET